MNTLGAETTNVFHKGPMAHKIHQSFEVGKRRMTITFSANFVTSNTINASVNGVAITAVPFNTDHATTFADLVTAIDGLSSVESATGNSTTRVITIILTDQEEDGIATAVVTGGASQATATIAANENDIFAGMPVQFDTDGTVKRLSGAANLDYIGYALMDAVAGELITICLLGTAIIKGISADAIIPGPVAFSGWNSTTGQNKFTDGSVTATNCIGWSITLTDGADDEIMVILK